MCKIKNLNSNCSAVILLHMQYSESVCSLNARRVCVLWGSSSQESFDFVAVADLNTEFLAERERVINNPEGVAEGLLIIQHILSSSMQLLHADVKCKIMYVATSLSTFKSLRILYCKFLFYPYNLCL